MTSMPQPIIDVHMHCFTGRRHANAVRSDVERLRLQGVRNMVVVGMVNTRLNTKEMWNLIPDFVENRGDENFHEVEDLLELTRVSDGVIVPLVDTRHLWGEVAPALDGYVERGFKGIKGIYLCDDGNDLGVRGVPETFGITLQQYQKREWEIFAYAEAHDLPLLYHLDARRHGDVMHALMADFPRVRVEFAHFGIGRKAFSGMLDRYPNVFTDFAGMLPHIRSNPAGYRDFFLAYPDRICFATDAVLYNADTILEYLAMVKELKLPEEVEAQILSGNALRFLGRALE
jgi:hypothetical protein